jgi:hypothetical protein
MVVGYYMKKINGDRYKRHRITWLLDLIFYATREYLASGWKIPTCREEM